MSTTITLTKDATSIDLPAPAPGKAPSIRTQQVLNRTQGGEARVHDLGANTYEQAILIETLTAAEKSNLASFFENVANGMMNTFTYI